MQLDRDDVFPIVIILLFGFGIPLLMWLGFGTRQQVIHQVTEIARDFAIVSVCFAGLIALFYVHSRRRETRLIRERGEQACSDFVAQFTSESERRAATIVFDTLRELSAVKRMPRLERNDQMSGPPLFLAQWDVEERLEGLFQELDLSLWLDPDGASALYGAKTVEHLVLALAHFIEQQGQNRYSPIPTC